MENRNVLTTNILVLSIVVFIAAFSRIIPHEPNFSIIGALALFSGAFFINKWLRFIIPLTAMFLSDILLGFHGTMPFVYGSFIVIALLGQFLQKNQEGTKLIAFSLLSSILFFIITNFGVWLISEMYSKNMSGLMIAYYMGIPFFRNTIISDLLYTLVLFKGFSFIENYLVRFRKSYTNI